MMGLDINVVIATNTLAVMFNSFISSIQFLSRNLIYYDYAVYFMIISSLGALLAVKSSDWVDKWGRKSYLVFILFTMMITSAVMLIVNGATQNGIVPLVFGNICN